jgi:hypothetical protein
MKPRAAKQAILQNSVLCTGQRTNALTNRRAAAGIFFSSAAPDSKPSKLMGAGFGRQVPRNELTHCPDL